MTKEGSAGGLKWDERGLVPVVVQEVGTNEVLMLAYMNEEALRRTTETGRMHYWSRSRGRLWQKGEESGNYQEMVSIYADCDLDALVAKVRQRGKGVACHTGARSCFFNHIAGKDVRGADILGELMAVLRERKEEPKEGSYTNLLLGDLALACEKLNEEAGELAEAVQGSDRHEPVHEAADLIYHMLVLLRAGDIELEQVWEALRARRK